MFNLTLKLKCVWCSLQLDLGEEGCKSVFSSAKLIVNIRPYSGDFFSGGVRNIMLLTNA